ncbi:hypothetical protein C2G38_784106 [Gigaspora rosea]|uniref:Uncharacterized protein n=1 Tax=Gigaspora rosea TaxID=44941 RepID=A0A397VMW0_9GLOM|nr:hypothetical protein C2G38_784106 [Gigaspora rosea]
MKMSKIIIGVVFLLIQISFVRAENLSYASTFLNISLPIPLESKIKSRISWASDFEFLFMRVAPIIYQFYICMNNPEDNVAGFSRYFNDFVQIILPPLLLLFPSLITPYEIYNDSFFIILRVYTIIMIMASIMSMTFSIYDFKRRSSKGLEKYYRYYKLFMIL